MKYLTQFLRILAFTLAGELLQRLVPLPIPASVYGLVLLFGALNTGLVKLEQVKDAGGFLISILPILFVSPAVGILDNWEAIRGALIPILALTLLSTVLTFGIAGRATQAVGILDNWEAIRGALIPSLALTLLSTVLTFGIAGRATQAMIGKEEKPNDASGEH